MDAPCGRLLLITALVLVPISSLLAAPPARTDRLGDPLPEGAVARLGTLRLSHHDAALAVAFSPDGKTLASGGSDGTLRLWDAATGRELRCWRDTDFYVAAVAFSPNGKLLAASQRNGVGLWDIASGKEIAHLGKPVIQGNGINRLAFLHDGNALILCRRDAILLWSVPDGRELPPSPIAGRDFVLTPDGKTLVVARDQGIDLIDISTGQVLRTFDVPASATRIEWTKEGKPEVAFGPGLVSFHGLALSPDGKILAALDGKGGTWSWDVATGDPRPPLPENESVDGLAFAPNGKSIVIARGADHLALYDLRSGKPRWRHPSGSRISLNAIVFAPDGQQFATAGDDGRVHLWNTGSGREFDLGRLPPNQVRACLSADGTTLATFGTAEFVPGRRFGATALHLCAIADGKPIRNRQLDTIRPQSITVSRPGNSVIAIQIQRDLTGVVVLDAATGKVLRRCAEPPSDVALSLWLLASPDGKTLAAADSENTAIVLWDLDTGRVRQRLTGHTDTVRCAAFSPDGKLLVTAAEDATVRTWDLATGHELRRLDGHGNFCVTALAFSADGSLLVTAGADGFIVLWDGHSGELRRRISLRCIDCASLALSPDGKLVAAASGSDTFSIWEVASGKLRSRTSAHEGGVTFLAFTPDGSRLVSVGGDATGLVWNVSELKVPDPPAKPARVDGLGDPLPDGAASRLGTERWYDGASMRPQISPDGKMLVAGCTGPIAIRAWNATTGKDLWRTPLHGGLDGQPVFSPNGKFVLVGEVGRVTILDTQTGEIVRRLRQPGRYITAFAVSPDGQTIATADWSPGVEGPTPSMVRLWRLSDGRELRCLIGHHTPLEALAFSADGRRLLSNGPDGMRQTDGAGHGAFIVWDLGTGKRLCHLPAREGLTFSGNGRLMAYRTDEGVICVDDIDGKERCRISQHSVWILSADGTMLATGDANALRLWDTATGKEVRELHSPFGSCGVPVGFSADGRRLLTRDDHHLHVWDVDRSKEIRPFPGHQDGVTCAAYSPDGRILMTGGEDRTVRFWEVRSSKELAVLSFPESAVDAVAFAPDGKIAAAAGREGTIRVWESPSGKLLQTLYAPGGEPKDNRFLAFSADGRSLTCCLENGFTVVWDLPARKEIHRQKHRDGEKVLGLSADGTLALSLAESTAAEPSKTPRLRVRHTLTGREIICVMGHPMGDYLSAAFSPDKKLFAVGWVQYRGSSRDHLITYDAKMSIFEVASGKEVSTLGRDHWFYHIVFSPDGRRLLGGSHRGAFVWDVASGAERNRCLLGTGHVRTVAFSSNGQPLAAALHGDTILTCDIAPTPPRPQPAPLRTAPDRDRLWSDLADSDASRAFQTAGRLIDEPERAVALLRQRLSPAVSVSPRALAALIAALEHDDFSERERARNDLEKLAELAEPALRQALAEKPSAELKRQLEPLLARLATDAESAERLRAIRATALLEQIDTAAARTLLADWSQGAPEARLTREAKASLQRLSRQVAAKP